MENQIVNPNTSIAITPVDPINAIKESGAFNAELFEAVAANPESFLRKTPFDGLGRKVTSEELEGKKVYFFDCAILDYEALDPDKSHDPNNLTPEDLKHYHYSAWRGVLDDGSGESIIYCAGTKLTKLADLLLNGQNDNAYNAVREKGAHLYFPKMRRLANGRTFMDPDLIP